MYKQPTSVNEVYFDSATKADVRGLLNQYHYIGSQCADPSAVFVWRRGGGLFGDMGPACAAALFAPPASFSWGSTTIELTRLVRDESGMPPLTGLLSMCLRPLRRRGFTAIIAYADPDVGHYGGVYQAASWIYLGLSTQKVVYVHKKTRKRSSQRSFDQSNYDRNDFDKVKTSRKYTYVFPLTKQERRKYLFRSKPYPKPKGA